MDATTSVRQLTDAAFSGARIAVVTETWPPEVNGVARTVSTLTRELARGGDKLLVIHPRGVAGLRGDWQECLVAGFPVPRYPGLRFGMPAVRRLQHALVESEIQAVYIATQGPLGWAASVAARRLDLRVVTGFHTNFQHYLQHYGFGPFRGICWAWLRRFHSRGALTLVPTESQGRELSADGFGPTAVLGRGVDCQMFMPERRDADLRRQWGADSEDLVMMHVGRLAAEKNLALAVRAFEALAPEFPGLRLVFVGDGPLEKSLRRRCSQAHFAGVRRGTDLARHYASADLLLVPSMSETFGNVVLEGMASGLPVCAFDYAAGQHIRNEENGFAAPFGHEDVFIDGVRRALSCSILRKRCGTNARATVQRMQWQGIAADFRRQVLGHVSSDTPIVSDRRACAFG